MFNLHALYLSASFRADCLWLLPPRYGESFIFIGLLYKVCLLATLGKRERMFVIFLG